MQTNADMLSNSKEWDLSRIYPSSLKSRARIDDEAWPCGLIAKFAFSDSFNSIKSTDRSFSVRIDDSDIAHPVDVDKKFLLNEDMLKQGAYWLNPEDEHIMVWYQMESLKDFKKLYGKVDGTLKKGKEYVISLNDQYSADLIDNEKHIVFAEIGTFGGKNFVLAYFFGLGAIISFMVLLFFCVGYFAFIKGRRLEQADYIKQLKY